MERLLSCGNGQRWEFLLLPQPREYLLGRSPLGLAEDNTGQLETLGSPWPLHLPSRDRVLLTQRTQREKTLTSSSPHCSLKSMLFFFFFVFISSALAVSAH